jgi:hypothetical protein
MPFDIYKNRVEPYEIGNYEKIGMDRDVDINSNGNPKRSLVNKAKIWFEEGGFSVRLVHETINKRSYLSDRSIKK